MFCNAVAQDAPPTRHFAAVERTAAFLLSPRAQGGVLSAAEGDLRGLTLPLSFVDSADYWGEYVCRLPDTACAVTDIYHPDDYTLTPQPGQGGVLQLERVMAHAGTNIYDAATWQIAIMLSGDAGAQRDALTDLGRALALRRATTQGTLFAYQGEKIEQPARAYAFRAISGAWLVRDPLAGTRFDSLVAVIGLPNRSDYQRGRVTWTDWKPITGENAWALFIGPLQAAYLHHVRQRGGHYVPFEDAAVQNALRVLPAFAAMQSPLGAVYYAPAGTAGTQGEGVVDPYEVSVENNFSLYAGLKIFSTTLQALHRQPGLNPAARREIAAARRTIAVMIHGGRSGARHTAGLLDFFRNLAWRNGEFVQGGRAERAWTPHLGVKAVDVQTWGIAALGGRQLDEWFGFGAAFELWQRTKRWGAYGVGTALWGVGYSDRDGNGIGADGRFRQGVLSAEWTAGAINMVRGLARHYESVAKSAADYVAAQRYASSLRADEAAMIAGVQHLRFDRYVTTDFPGKPARYSALLQFGAGSAARGAYLYASRRHAIPFGWYANPLPSTCASAWMIMLAHDFDPFAYAGRLL